MATKERALRAPEILARGGADRHPCYPLIVKLEAVAVLCEEDKEAICGICDDIHEIAAKKDIIREGENPHFVNLVLEGWAARYKIVPNGSRQITAFLLPGDFCDLHVTVLGEMDHNIMTLTPAKVAHIPQEVVEDLPINRPAIAQALWWATLVDEAVLRSWIVNLGRRDATERIAHLFCELHSRMKMVGQVRNGRFALPLTQEVIADTVGLTPVHVNRMLKRLRAEGLIALKGGDLTILDLDRLGKLAGFNPNYLHRRRLSRR